MIIRENSDWVIATVKARERWGLRLASNKVYYIKVCIAGKFLGGISPNSLLITMLNILLYVRYTH